MVFKALCRFTTLNKNEISYNTIITQFYDIKLRFINHTQICTDVSKSEYGVGFAIFHIQTTIRHKLPTITNMFTAENYAILEAIRLANSFQTSNILLISDSFGVRRALKIS